jgi:hypothetical protein
MLVKLSKEKKNIATTTIVGIQRPKNPGTVRCTETIDKNVPLCIEHRWPATIAKTSKQKQIENSKIWWYKWSAEPKESNKTTFQTAHVFTLF